MNSNRKESTEFEEISLSDTKRSRKNTVADVSAGPQNGQKQFKNDTFIGRKKKLAVLIMCIINLLNYMDRLTVAGVLTSIQEFYSLNDAQGGILQTIFVVFFMIFAPIFGYFGDRLKRKNIMLCGLTIWVTAVLLSSYIPSRMFWAFLLLRGVVGIGEASYSTIAPTIFADLFVGKIRSQMLMIFYFAIPVGSGLGYVVGSSVANISKVWQWGLRVTPPFGFLSIAALFLLLDEPPRGRVEFPLVSMNGQASNNNKNNHSNKQKSSLIADILYLSKNRTYLLLNVAYTSVVFVVGTLAWWAPTAIEHATASRLGISKTSDLDKKTKEEIAFLFGAITCLAGITGVATGTFTSQAWKSGKLSRFGLKANIRADALISAIGSFCALPFLMLGFHLIISYPKIAWWAIFVAITFLSLNWAIIIDMLLHIIIPNRRSIANSILILFCHLFGDASGPYIIGSLSDLIRRDDSSPTARFYSLLKAFYVPNFLLILSGVAFLLCAVTLRKDLISPNENHHRDQSEKNSISKQQDQQPSQLVHKNGTTTNPA